MSASGKCSEQKVFNMVKVKIRSGKGLKCSLIFVLIVHHWKKGDNAAVSVVCVQVGQQWPCLFFVFGTTKLMHAQYSNIVYALA